MDFKEKANEVQEKLKEQLGNIDTEKLKEQAKGVADKAVDFAKEQVEKIDTDKLGPYILRLFNHFGLQAFSA